jgi:hypothetical protein
MTGRVCDLELSGSCLAGGKFIFNQSASRGNRTLTPIRETDFKSVASTCSAIEAQRIFNFLLYLYNKVMHHLQKSQQPF